MRVAGVRKSQLFAGGVALAVLLTTAACGSTEEAATPSESPTTAAQAEGWPCTFENAWNGTTTEIPSQPTQIVSTSVTATGTLLAIDAPVVASAAAGNGAFFAQWDSVAQEQGVETLWSAGSVDLELLIAQDPDLIVVSSTGADSVVDQVAELNAIAPTIVVDYGGQTWESLAEELGEATGLEANAEKSVADFTAYVADAKAKVSVPEGSANIVSYTGPGEVNPIGRATSAQALLLTELGFSIEDPNVEWHTQPKPREDFVFANYENLTELTADTTFVLSQDNAGAQGFAKDSVLANLPSVKNGQVYGLGLNSFRIDKYSAMEIVDTVVENFAK